MLGAAQNERLGEHERPVLELHQQIDVSLNLICIVTEHKKYALKTVYLSPPRSTVGRPQCVLIHLEGCSLSLHSQTSNASSGFHSVLRFLEMSAVAFCIPGGFHVKKMMRRGGQPQANLCSQEDTVLSTRPISGLSEVISSYKCVFLDQFGVLHDGQRAYPSALNTLQRLKDNNVQMVIISNSSRRAASTRRALKRYNIDESLISGIVTSGELAMKTLSQYTLEHPQARVLHLNWGSSSRSTISITEHGFTNIARNSTTISGIATPTGADVDVIVAHGITGLTQSDGSVEDIEWDVAVELVRSIARDAPHVPFYVANPDLVTVDGPILRKMPGSLAREFERAGGQNVIYLGKPSQIAYDEALSLAGVAPDDVLAIGDSIGHDIRGAAAASIDSLYVI